MCGPERAEPLPAATNGRPLAASLDELLAGATERAPLHREDGKSGVPFERVVIGGEPFVVKHLHVDRDWIARATGELTPRPVEVWRSGLLDRAPACIDHAVVGAAAGLGRNGWGGALLMRDVEPWLVPEGDTTIPFDQHRSFLDHMAALHAELWGWEGGRDLMPLSHRYMFFGPWLAEAEAKHGSGAAVPLLAAQGWARLPERAPGAADVVLPLVEAPWPLVAALEATPITFVHGDWKAGNLGTGPDGRTILLDWSYPGRGPVAGELAWYLAVNAARLPEPYEDAIDAYRRALTSAGVDTSGWWDRQLGLALLGALVQLGWDKALHADPADLAWWEEQAVAGARHLDSTA